MSDRLAAALADRYRLERELGQGGMATVYLAQDLKHGRKVAIKVLKPELAAVLGAERFVQEIATTAQLQHPNILPLFDSGSADGFLYYVMPYVEGETLRAKLDRETQLGVDEAVKITGEVADALQYAHEHGVVHRDIKPENILLHAGRPMVADFGIALAVSAAAGGRMTETGLSLGTPHYMSPEQATAEKTITNRSDIYSLGAVLYEMLTGEPPHTGTSAQQVIMRIVTEKPRSVSDARESVPPNVAAAVTTALQKLPADRFESAKAFAGALANVAFTTARGASTPARRSTVLARHPGLIWLLGAACTVFAVTSLWGWLRPMPTPPPTQERILLQKYNGWAAVALWSTIAPDGSAIVYGDTVQGTRQLWIKERGVLQPRPLVPLSLAGDAAPAPSFSPSGEWILYTSNGKLQKVSRQGGSPTQVSDLAASVGAWMDDGTIVFVGADGGTLYAMPPGGGRPQPVYTTVATILEVTAVPGARVVLFSAIGGGIRPFTLDLDTDSVRALGVDDAAVAWVVLGTLVYATSSGQLGVAPFDARHLTVRGLPRPILQGIRTTSGLPDATVGRDGTLLYAEGPASRGGERVSVVSVSRDGGVDPTSTTVLSYDGSMALSPDGSRLAITVGDSTTGKSKLSVIRLASGIATRLIFTATNDFRPAWSPDGTTILYVSDAGGPVGLWTTPADGGGQAAPVKLVESRQVFAGCWSPDRKWLVYRTTTGAKASADILAVRTSGDSTPIPLAATDAQEVSPAISPDGHWLAYASMASGRSEIYVKPFPNASAGMWLVSSDGSEPLWSHSGRELFYRNARGELVAVAVSEAPTFAAGKHTTLFNAQRYLAIPVDHSYAVEPDDKHFLFLQPLSTPEVSNGGALVLMRNWLPAEETLGSAR